MYKNSKPILGGVCLSYSETSNINVKLLRFLLILVSIPTSGIPALIYLFFWFIKVHNEKDTEETKKAKIIRRLTYFLAILIGSVLGPPLGWEIGQLMGYTGGASIMSALFAIIGLPLGGITGFAIVKRLSLKNHKPQL